MTVSLPVSCWRALFQKLWLERMVKLNQRKQMLSRESVRVLKHVETSQCEWRETISLSDCDRCYKRKWERLNEHELMLEREEDNALLTVPLHFTCDMKAIKTILRLPVFRHNGAGSTLAVGLYRCADRFMGLYCSSICPCPHHRG